VSQSNNARADLSLIPAPDAEPSRDDEIIGQWLHGRKSTTAGSYATDISQCLEWAGLGLEALTLPLLQDWADELEDRDLAASTRRRKLAALKSLLGFAARRGYAARDESVDLQLPPQDVDALASKVLSLAEVRALLLAGNPFERVVLRFLYQSGCRASELARLRWTDLREIEGGGLVATLYGKGSKTRWVDLTAGLARELATMRAGGLFDAAGLACAESLVFGLSRFELYRLVADCAERAGLGKPVSPHWLRHTCATHLLERGVPVHIVQQRLGHTSLNVTTRYVQIGRGARAAECLEIEDAN